MSEIKNIKVVTIVSLRFHWFHGHDMQLQTENVPAIIQTNKKKKHCSFQSRLKCQKFNKYNCY